MRLLALTLLPAAATAHAAPDDAAWRQSLVDWRGRAEKSLRADNGWLTLAGRFVMKPGASTFGTGEGNDIVFPKGLGPERMGTLTVLPRDKKVALKLEPGVAFRRGGAEIRETMLGTDLEKRDWVTRGRLAMHVIEREGRYVLRLADNESVPESALQWRLAYYIGDVEPEWSKRTDASKNHFTPNHPARPRVVRSA